MRHRFVLSFLSALSTIIIFTPTLDAQVNQSAISGTVSDSSGAAVQGARIELLSPLTGLHRDAVTDAAGIYHLPALPVGNYKITISREGFRTVEYPDVELSLGQPRTIDVRLEVGTISNAVQVTASVENLNRSSAELGGLVDADQIKGIPISGRNWASLMLLVPGAINYGDGAQRAIRFTGHSLDDSNFTFDGIDTSGVQEQTQKADTRLNIALDSISEFHVSTKVYTAETGAAGGAQVNVVSKSGTNQYHGSTFYALRNARWMRDRRSMIRAPDCRHSRCISSAAASVARSRRQGVLLFQLRRPAAESGTDFHQLCSQQCLSRAGAGQIT